LARAVLYSIQGLLSGNVHLYAVPQQVGSADGKQIEAISGF
jgi:hypothetical protein